MYGMHNIYIYIHEYLLFGVPGVTQCGCLISITFKNVPFVACWKNILMRGLGEYLNAGDSIGGR